MDGELCSASCPCGSDISAEACVREPADGSWTRVCRAGLAIHRLRAARPQAAPDEALRYGERPLALAHALV
jgi:hypothetical protein